MGTCQHRWGQRREGRARAQVTPKGAALASGAMPVSGTASGVPSPPSCPPAGPGESQHRRPGGRCRARPRLPGSSSLRPLSLPVCAAGRGNISALSCSRPWQRSRAGDAAAATCPGGRAPRRDAENAEPSPRPAAGVFIPAGWIRPCTARAGRGPGGPDPHGEGGGDPCQGWFRTGTAASPGTARLREPGMLPPCLSPHRDRCHPTLGVPCATE